MMPENIQLDTQIKKYIQYYIHMERAELIILRSRRPSKDSALKLLRKKAGKNSVLFVLSRLLNETRALLNLNLVGRQPMLGAWWVAKSSLSG